MPTSNKATKKIDSLRHECQAYRRIISLERLTDRLLKWPEIRCGKKGVPDICTKGYYLWKRCGRKTMLLCFASFFTFGPIERRFLKFTYYRHRIAWFKASAIFKASWPTEWKRLNLKKINIRSAVCSRMPGRWCFKFYLQGVKSLAQEPLNLGGALIVRLQRISIPRTSQSQSNCCRWLLYSNAALLQKCKDYCKRSYHVQEKSSQMNWSYPVWPSAQLFS